MFPFSNYLLMAFDRTAHILSTALWRFSLQALHLTTTGEIAKHAGVSVGTLFRTFPTKEDLLDNVYAYAITQLQQPLLAGPGNPQPYENLTKLLQRWWHLSAQVALDQPHIFDFWCLYKTYLRSPARSAPLLGPFEPVVGLLERAISRQKWSAKNQLPIPVMVAALTAQWTAALDLVLTDSTCQTDATLRQQVLERAYVGWWQGLGVPDYTEVEVVPR
jgi:AcrR family transcriptional regulator